MPSFFFVEFVANGRFTLVFIVALELNWVQFLREQQAVASCRLPKLPQQLPARTAHVEHTNSSKSSTHKIIQPTPSIISL